MAEYLTIAAPAEAQYTDKRSRFLAFALPVRDAAEARAAVADLQRRYHDARHVCWAYMLGSARTDFLSNDNGEPSGTAGKPILGQINSLGLSDVLVAVVRYFGGVKLGTGGLAVAYKTAAAEALQAAVIEERIMTADFRVSVPYADADVAMRYVREAGAQITAREYTAIGAVLTIAVRLDDEAALRSRLSKIRSLHFTDENVAE